MIHESRLYMEVAISASLVAGQLLIDRFGDPVTAARKESIRDVYSEIDLDAESRAIDVIASKCPGTGILSEERGVIGALNDSYWIIDALDGTVNYLHQIPFYAVSIAHISHGKADACAVFFPAMNELFFAAKGLGAFKNQKKISVNDDELERSLLAVSFSGKHLDDRDRLLEYELFGRMNDISSGCLRTGSAALNLAFLAEGRFNGCWGKLSRIWDVAAGLLLAEEAGAKTKIVRSPKFTDRISYIAACESVFESLVGIVVPCFGGDN